MHILQSSLKNFDEDALKSFIDKKIPEGHHLDYKLALSGNTKEKQYREFLKDTTAFANANGGDILIGVKEPEEELSLDDQIVGIEEGDKLAENLERVASSSIDPRIPGLQTIPIHLSNGKYVILVHIPPSFGKPYMVDYNKTKTHTFYIRHRESSFLMTTFEIKQSVLSSATVEEKASVYLKRMELDAIVYFIDKNPAFLIQAMPIIPTEQPLDTLSDEVVDIIRGANRRIKYGNMCLSSMVTPYPTINGIQGEKSRDDTQWITDFHRNGYMGLSYLNKEIDRSGKYWLSKEFYNLFKAFFDICENLLKIASFESPYIVRCQYLNATGTILDCSNRTETVYNKQNIFWPEIIKQTGDPFLPIADTFIEQMFHAFGLHKYEM